VRSGGYSLHVAQTAPYLRGVRVVPERLPNERNYPYSLGYAPSLDLNIESAVTFFVGENGSGKSTLIEALAVLCGLPVSGGGRNEIGSGHGPEADSVLSRALRPSFIRRPRDGYFLRAEFQAHFASLLDARREDPDFIGNPYARYGGKSLHTQSHGEAFLAVLQNRIREGLFFLDEPESALSPQRQLALLVLMDELIQEGRSQFVIATHSPILMTYPGATIISFDNEDLRSITLEDTDHYRITRGILDDPVLYWKHLRDKRE
jgi:predicted ATPase